MMIVDVKTFMRAFVFSVHLVVDLKMTAEQWKSLSKEEQAKMCHDFFAQYDKPEQAKIEDGVV
ncbi:MAG: hypothetical protein FWC33_03325 [Candidatus Bathyarchaeota archaeon]|nr:hypothetical protein [Candidatus Termiticorpusculum sp.]